MTTKTGIRSLLQTLADDVLRPSAARRDLARRRYEDVTRYLQKHMGAKLDCHVWVYPQGSYRLGTTVVSRNSQAFDVDLIVAYDLERGDTSQREIVTQMHGWLVRYYDEGHGGGDLAPDDYRKTRRAFVLDYGDDFHMDILPVVLEKPKPLGSSGQPSWLSDRDLHHWQATNPRGYAEYFESQMADEFATQVMAKGVDVDPLPGLHPLTNLQRAVMLGKRHRDVMFDGDLEDAPHSALITALMTSSYVTKGRSARLEEVVLGMRDQLGWRNGELWVPNPTWRKNGVEMENYADRYAGETTKIAVLEQWLTRIESDVTGVESSRNIPERSQRISKAWGEGAGEAAADAHGRSMANRSSVGAITGSASGLAAGRASYQRPPFHGDGS